MITRQNKIAVRLIAFALTLIAGISCGSGDKPFESPASGKNYTRIVSLAPNITETLFALGLGGRVAGITRFCTYPPEALKKPRVGGFLDVNFEALAALNPDLAILLPEHEEARKRIAALGVQTLTVHNRVVGEILETIKAIGKTCGAETRADSLTHDIETRMNAVRERTKGLPKPRTLIVVERRMREGVPGAVYAAGPNTFYDELITLAGGTNAYRGPAISYPEISTEGILRLDPEVIVDIIPTLEKQGMPEETARAAWKRLADVTAVKTGRVYVIGADYAAVPGPRFILTLEVLSDLLHGRKDRD